jgi:hypothetical protein
VEYEYVNRLLIYLKQELPQYKDQLEVKNGRLTITVPADLAFAPFYENVFNSVTATMTHIGNRKTDVEFTVRSSVQERDFKILK